MHKSVSFIPQSLPEKLGLGLAIPESLPKKLGLGLACQKTADKKKIAWEIKKMSNLQFVSFPERGKSLKDEKQFL